MVLFSFVNNVEKWISFPAIIISFVSNQDYYKEAGKSWIISVYIVVKALYPTQESKIRDIAAKGTVKKPGELHGKGKKWPLILITGGIRKDAKSSGRSITLAITGFIEINILSIPRGTGAYRQYEITGAAKTSRAKCLQSWTRY